MGCGGAGGCCCCCFDENALLLLLLLFPPELLFIFAEDFFGVDVFCFDPPLLLLVDEVVDEADGEPTDLALLIIDSADIADEVDDGGLGSCCCW